VVSLLRQLNFIWQILFNGKVPNSCIATAVWQVGMTVAELMPKSVLKNEVCVESIFA